MRFGLKVPSSKSRLIANGKRGLQNPYFDPKNGLQNPYFDLKNGLQNPNYYDYQLFL